MHGKIKKKRRMKSGTEKKESRVVVWNNSKRKVSETETAIEKEGKRKF